MRIRLKVQRHSLPPAHVLWTVGGTSPPYTAAAVGVTISQLLEQINDVIPLESEDWGLEDYSVEIGGFECLHFSELSQVLKEDDEVCIRPLQTSDLRFRRRSGRHQITADGRHIIDGVAFGRPFLRRTERPAIKIPPRKRRRVTYDRLEDDSEGDINNNQQVTVHAGFDSSDVAPAENEDDERDGDFVGPGQEEEDLSAEIEDIHRDSASASIDVSARARPRRSTTLQARAEGLGLQGSELLDLRDENGRPYPNDYNNPLLELYSGDDPERMGSNAKKRKRKSLNDLENLNKSSNSDGRASSAIQALNRQGSSASSKSVRFEDNAPATPPTTILDPDDSDDTEDEEFEPPAEVDEETDESDKENAAPKLEEDVSSEVMSSESDSSSSSSDSEDDIDDTSSSGSSSTSSSDAKTEIEEPSGSSKMVGGDVDGSSSSGSSSSSSATSSDQQSPGKNSATKSKSVQKSRSTPEQAKDTSYDSKVQSPSLTLSKRQYIKFRRMKEPDRVRGWLKGVLVADSKGQVEQAVLYHAYRNQFQEESALGNDLVSAETLIRTVPDLFAGARAERLSEASQKYFVKGIRPCHWPTKTMSKLVPPGQGKQTTRIRNKRRKLAQASRRMERASERSNGEIPIIIASESEQVRPATKVGIEVETSKSCTADLQFEARRQALLDAISSGGVEVVSQPSMEAPNTQYLVSPTVPIDVSVGSNKPLLPEPGENDSSDAPSSEDLVQPSPINESGASDIKETENVVVKGQSLASEIIGPVEPTAAQITVEKAPVQSSKPRSKIDLASSRRLLFGALGLRTPKSKDDEKALQIKLMKDVKPMKNTQNTDETPHDMTEPAGDEDESWRDKIDLRAVECCYDDIELSTPPFPFVQRWDPQQKRGYQNVDAKRKSGKRNKRKRNSERYYDDDWEEQASMPAAKRGKSASPAVDHNDEDTQMAVGGEQLPEAPSTSSDQNQGAVNEQLLRESQEAVANAVAEDSFQEDLPPLPADLTKCPDLTIETAQPGTIIAFKKLDMSVETNWQPRVSEYRTAIVDEHKDDGTLYMALAFRDRLDQEAAYDPETGERLYHKFEMPGYDNEEGYGAEGHLELPLAELIEPKILQAPESKGDEAPASAASGGVNDDPKEDPTAEAGETETRGDNDTSKFDESWEGFEESTKLDQLEPSDLDEELENVSFPVEKNAISQMDRVREADQAESIQDIEPHQEIKEAVQSMVGDLDEVAYPDLGDRIEGLVKMRGGEASAGPIATSGKIVTLLKITDSLQGKEGSATASDPLRQEISALIKDAGWRSSIRIPVEDQPGSEQEPQHPYQEEIKVNVQSSNPPSPNFNVFVRSSIGEAASETLPAEIPETYQDPHEVADSLPHLPSDHVESANDHLAESNAADNDMAPLNDDEESLLWDAQTSAQAAPHRSSSSISPPLMSSTLKAESKNKIGSQGRLSISPPQITKANSEARPYSTQHRSSISPPKVSKARTKARNSGPQAKTSFKNPFGTDGTNPEEELPSLEKVFASRISSLQPTSSQSSIKPEDSQVNLHNLPRHKSSRKSQSSQPFRSTESSSIASQLPILSDDGNEPTDWGFSSQAPQKTQVVDLTLSSDPMEPSDSAYEGDSSLPNGPGWIAKLRSSQRARSVGKDPERRSNGGVALVGR